MSYLIEKDGERCFVDNLKGYGDWTVLAEGDDARPVEHADFRGGRWHVDPAKKAKAERRAKARTMDREEILDRIEALENRLAALEAANKKPS